MREFNSVLIWPNHSVLLKIKGKDMPATNRYLTTNTGCEFGVHCLNQHYVRIVILCDLATPTVSECNTTAINTNPRCWKVCQMLRSCQLQTNSCFQSHDLRADLDDNTVDQDRDPYQTSRRHTAKTPHRYLDHLSAIEKGSTDMDVRLQVLGTCYPYKAPAAVLSLPELDFGDIYMYLTENPWPYTAARVKAYWSTDSYMYFCHHLRGEGHKVLHCKSKGQ